MGEPVVFSTKKQMPYSLDRLFVPIISIDRLSKDYQDLPVDEILALGDQALLLDLSREPPRSRFNAPQSENPMRASVYSGKSHAGGEWLSKVSQVRGDRVVAKLHHELKEEFEKYIREEAEQVTEFQRELGGSALSQPITQPSVFGSLVNTFYGTLSSLKKRWSKGKPYEILLYLSGHGMDPGNICLIPDEMKPHPTRPTRPEHDLRKVDPKNWYKYPTIIYPEEVNERTPDHEAEQAQRAELYLDTFYHACNAAIGSEMVPLGFVGGEVYAHHRGFIGVLGVLGLWCHAHRECKDDTYGHLVIVADCCFAGIWGNTLVSVMKSESLEDYRKLLRKYPVSIQCATNEFEASHGGVFTPLWYFLQTAQKEELDGYHSAFVSERELMSDDEIETQHPWYVSTSKWCPTWKLFDNPDFFIYLHGTQLQQLEGYLQCTDVREDNCPPLVRPFIVALTSEAKKLSEKLECQLRAVKLLERATEAFRASHLPSVEQSIITIEQSYTCLSNLLFNVTPRSQRALQHYVLDAPGDRLSEANYAKLKNLLRPQAHNEERVIDSGVYVFQGGEGDMSLIVTPGYKQVILIDGTKTADCFSTAWDSTLKYLPKFTHIFVTHHDEDHTFGIQLLLARYVAEQADSLPDLSTTIIYMNTRFDFLHRNFGHEREIATLAKRLGVKIQPLIIEDTYKYLHAPEDGRRFFLTALLPRKQLVDGFRGKVPEDKDSTKPVSSRGGTTAANVLSINLVAVWKRDAYLFTGDAHLKDVTEAAQNFLRIHGMDSFKYVDVPHHGSANSNVKKVAVADRGMAGISAEHYLISHCGNHHNPSFQTVKDILQKENCQTLHFLYQRRMSKPSVKLPSSKPPPGISCQECKVGHTTTTDNWHCKCVCKKEQDKISLPHTCHYWECFKFFPFVD